MTDKIRNKFYILGGFPPQRKNALKAGNELVFKNEKGELRGTVVNNCRSDEKGFCRVCLKVNHFELDNIISVVD